MLKWMSNTALVFAGRRVVNNAATTRASQPGWWRRTRSIHRKRFQKRLKIKHFRITQFQRTNVGIRHWIAQPTSVVFANDIQQGVDAAIVQIRCGGFQFAQAGHFLQAKIAVATGSIGAANIGVDRQAIVAEAFIGVVLPGMAATAAGLAFKQLQTACFGRVESRTVASAVVIHAIARREFRRLEACQSGGDVLGVGRLTIDTLKRAGVGRISTDALHDG